jgi:hypothetical protein
VRRPGPQPKARLWLVGVALIAACTAGGPSAGASRSPTATFAPVGSSAATSPGHASAQATAAATSSGAGGGGCVLDTQTDDWAPVAADPRRCLVTIFSPPMSFDSSPGWQWTGSPDRWSMGRQAPSPYEPAYYLSVYRYGGAVVPPYCVDPPDTIAMSAGEDVVAWLDTVPGLEVDVVARTVESHPAWEVHLSAPGVESCSGDPEKGGLASLWTIDGAPIELPQSLGEDNTLLVYLIELPSGIVVMTAGTTSGDAKPREDAAFWVLADEVFRSVIFE